MKLPGRRLSEAGWVRGKAAEVGELGRPLCRWCRLEILAKRRRTFCSDYCVHQWRLRSDPGYLRDQVFLRDKGVCNLCGTDTVAEYAEVVAEPGEGAGRVAGGLGDPVGWGQAVAVGCRPCAACGRGRWGV